jgi:perosamine synthetase
MDMQEQLFTDIIKTIKDAFNTSGFVPLHVPVFSGNEKRYLADCIDTGYVSSVGEYVNKFEEMFKDYVGAGAASAAVNGTAALQTALRLVGVDRDDEVITQALSFIGTANAVSYCGAKPIFIDVEKATLGMDPDKLSEYLEYTAFRGDDGRCYNKTTRKRISACVPVHIFGHPCRIETISAICASYGNLQF